MTAAVARARANMAPSVGALLGLEHEYRVLNRSGVQVDFRAVLPGLAVEGRRLDPGDAHARRLTWGAALTADDREAEIALPPVPARRGAATLVRDLAERARVELAALLPEGHGLVGYSTHLSIAMPTGLADALAPRYARTFAPALMLLLDGPEAPGLLVRPRPGRLELGGDYCDGDGLRAAMLFAVGSARALAAGRDRGRVPLLAVRPEPAVDRYGWYVDRAAFGADLYNSGRQTVLGLADGGTITAGALLTRTWAIARRSLRDLASAADLALVDAIVAGHSPLPVEAGRTPNSPTRAGRIGDAPVGAHPPQAAFRAPEGAILDDVVRPGFRLRATLATWEFAAFEITGARRAAASVARAELGSFLAAASTGLLDGPIEAFLARPSAGSRLNTHAQATGSPRLYDGIGDPRGLLASEPDGSRAIGGTGSAIGATMSAAALAGGLAGLDIDDAGLGGGRPGKRRPRDRRESDDQHPDQTDPPVRPGPRVPPGALLTAAAPIAALPVIPIVIGGAGVAVVAAVLLAAGVLGGRATPSAAVNPSVAPSAGIGEGSPSATALESPAQTAVTPGLPPPIAEARIAGIYSDGPSDSFHLVVTPACGSGACDGSATILSLPFAEDSPRGSISMVFADTVGTYAGSGTATVPFCRTVTGRLLTVDQTYRLDGFRATEQQLVDGRWIATRIEGMVTTGAASAAGDGTTCNANEGANPVVLQRIAPAPEPGATPPPLAEARFGGTYAMAPEAASAFTVVPGCVLGACDATMSYEAFLDPAQRVTTSAPLALAGGRYSGQGISAGLLCTATSRVDVTLVFTDLEATGQAVVDGQWIATTLTGTVRRLPFSGTGCSGAEESTPVILSRTP